MIYLTFLAGLAGLFFGGGWLVSGASGVAQAFRVPPLVIGLVLVGFGTSAPELLVQDLIRKLEEHYAVEVEVLAGIAENVHFRLPPELAEPGAARRPRPTAA